MHRIGRLKHGQIKVRSLLWGWKCLEWDLFWSNNYVLTWNGETFEYQQKTSFKDGGVVRPPSMKRWQLSRSNHMSSFFPNPIRWTFTYSSYFYYSANKEFKIIIRQTIISIFAFNILAYFWYDPWLTWVLGTKRLGLTFFHKWV